MTSENMQTDQPKGGLLVLPLKQDSIDKTDILDGRGVAVASTMPSARELRNERAAFIVTAVNAHAGMKEALEEAQAFITVMFARGPDGIVPDQVPTPLGPPIKLGEIMRAIDAALRTAAEGK